MIVVDTSALVAIAFSEPERAVFTERILSTDRVLISTVSALETRMVVHGRRGERAVLLVDELLRLPMFEIVAAGKEEMDCAYAAFITYGRGSGHPAGLNFGDVFSYALAKVRGLPLLFKGNDFAQTDLVPAWLPD
ncbi:type II toxin-antitoxin system VapC family toxin [Sphaerotilus microaerophilus]|jgi:ribonuclease VapC|uniref:Ribonuclease VapC n=1 Tax=Sphaerotilus microaerophilus TaxID=2914710 RepID=A0ABN6PUU8_9BURK|nr:type II toxin-antitoxin system VapC family toxin [Sphaerotilus sp. FB-5]BDI07347.1 ribonuclease VapC [Sphaerotilus sp. FB-5]